MKDEDSPEPDTLTQVDLPDFDTLMRMAKEKPEDLENLLRNEVNKLISSAPDEHYNRLKGLQFQIDTQRMLAKNPVDSCVRISKMMNESFSDLNLKLNELAKIKS